MNKKPFVIIITVLSLLSVTTNDVYSKNKTLTLDNKNLYSVDSLKKDAKQALKNKDYKRAAFLYGQLVGKLPGNDEMLISYAYSLFMNGDLQEASVQFNKVKDHSTNQKYIEYALASLDEIEKINKKESDSKEIKIVVNVAPRAIIKKQKEEKFIEIDNNKKEHYLCNESDPTIFEDKLGETFRRWEKSEMPIRVYIPTTPKSYNVEDPAKYISLVKKSMIRWSEKVPAISFVYVPTMNIANIIVNWVDYFEDEGTWGLTSLPVYSKKLKRRLSLLNLAIRAQPGTATFTDNAIAFSDEEFVEIATHEVGHALGLAHSYHSRDNEDIMVPSYRSTLPSYRAEITQRDVNSLTKLYSIPADSVCKCK